MEEKLLNVRQPLVAFLHDLKRGEADGFGAKVSGLVDAIAAGATVLPGVAVSVDLAKRISSTNVNDPCLDMIAQQIARLKLQHCATSFVVRSSSIWEDDPRCNLSGVFRSYAGISSLEEIGVAIRSVVAQARDPVLSEYFEEFGFEPGEDHMAILIQPQADPEFGGVIQMQGREVLIEYTKNSISRAISGEIPYSSCRVKGGNFERLSLQECDRGICVEEHIAPSFFNEEFWCSASRSRATVEFFVQGGVFHVAQVKSGWVDVLPEAQEMDDLLPFSAPNSAGKFAAMQFFSENKLFGKPLVMLQRGWTVAEAVEAARKVFDVCENVTLRLAKGVEIGLPRVFCSDIGNVIAFAEHYHRSSYDLIVHGYIDVERSLEILVDHNGFLIEHIPGMWESSNANQPDVLVVRNGSSISYRFNGDREPVIENRTSTEAALGEPLTAGDFENLLSFGSKVWSCLNATSGSDFPLNIHAVCNASFAEFHCLNIRPGHRQGALLLPAQEARIVHDINDLEDWIPTELVRLSLSLDRGTEGTLLPLARKLLLARHPIIIDFGILSHPAMILRRLGCKLIPSYAVAGCMPETSYTIEQQSLDVGLDPINRILDELPEIEAENYHVVSDLDPLSSKHWVGVSRQSSASTADDGALCEVTRIIDAFPWNGEIFFFEKGRSAFCTSIFTTPRGHFHLIGGSDFGKHTHHLSERIGGRRYSSLELAYKNVPTEGPYVVFGTPSRGFWVASGRESYEKGLLRETFQTVGASSHGDN